MAVLDRFCCIALISCKSLVYISFDMLISACYFSEGRDLSYGGHEAILTRRFGHGQDNKKMKIVEIVVTYHPSY